MQAFQHLFVDGPTFWKEQIAHLEIYVAESKKEKSLKDTRVRVGNLLEATVQQLEYAESLGRPFSAEDLANEFDINKKRAQKILANWISVPETYGVEVSHVVGRERYYRMIKG